VERGGGDDLSLAFEEEQVASGGVSLHGVTGLALEVPARCFTNGFDQVLGAEPGEGGEVRGRGEAAADVAAGEGLRDAELGEREGEEGLADLELGRGLLQAEERAGLGDLRPG